MSKQIVNRETLFCIEVFIFLCVVLKLSTIIRAFFRLLLLHVLIHALNFNDFVIRMKKIKTRCRDDVQYMLKRSQGLGDDYFQFALNVCMWQRERMCALLMKFYFESIFIDDRVRSCIRCWNSLSETDTQECQQHSKQQSEYIILLSTNTMVFDKSLLRLESAKYTDSKIELQMKLIFLRGMDGIDSEWLRYVKSFECSNHDSCNNPIDANTKERSTQKHRRTERGNKKEEEDKQTFKFKYHDQKMYRYLPNIQMI